MDADFKERRGQRISSQREKRWSMNSARLEEIVAELMKPISDLRRIFDRDQSGLLEEYLSEAGVRALDDSAGSMPNFAELALVLQHTTSTYSRKVDCLHNQVISMASSFNSNTEIANTAEEESAVPSSGHTPRRRRTEHAPADFGAIDLEPANSAVREPGCARPPPTLPRAYITLAPPPVGDHAVALTDYSGAPIGLLRDYHCCWSLRDGLLVDGLTQHSSGTLRPIPLIELQQAIEARAPPPLACSSPLPEPALDADHPDEVDDDVETAPSPPAAPDTMPPPALPAIHKERKRKNETVVDLDGVSVKLHVTQELLESLRAADFDVSMAWRDKVVTRRSLAVLTLRREQRQQRTPHWRGFDTCPADTRGFPGWSACEVESATITSLTVSTALGNASALQPPATAAATAARRDDSDDDGFFEQSSLGDSDLCVSQLTQNCSATPVAPVADDWAAWQARVLRRAQAAEAAGAVDVNKLAETVLNAIPDAHEAKDEPKLFTDVLRETVKKRTDVSRLFLATLFLANSGNVEIIPGPPLTVDTFSVRVLSRDTSRYSHAADELFASTTAAASDSANTPSTNKTRVKSTIADTVNVTAGRSVAIASSSPEKSAKKKASTYITTDNVDTTIDVVNSDSGINDSGVDCGRVRPPPTKKARRPDR